MAQPERPHTAFALALNRQLDGGELVWSPYSVASALCLLASGARGATRNELARALMPGERDPAGALEDLRALLGAGARLGDRDGAGDGNSGDRGSGLAIANTLWTKPELPIESGYETEVASWPGGALHALSGAPGEAAETVNAEIAKITRGMITDLVDAASVADAEALLVNALWVHLAWQDPFDVGRTAPLEFHAPAGAHEVPAMRKTASLSYAAGAGWRMVTLPGHGDLALDVLLPEEPLESARLGPADYLALRGAAHPTEVALALPRFELTDTRELLAPLTGLGVGSVFTDDAELGGISPHRLCVDGVLHRAVLRVDESGAEGAAATAVRLVAAAITRRPEPIVFAVDRPFMAILRHTSGALYFLATITDPSDPGPAGG